MSEPYDVIIIGSGPGGYVCAIRAAQLGMKVAIVEKRQSHGGTCLNVGCIPSKALLHASETFEHAHTKFEEMGIVGGKPKLDLKKMLSFKDSVVEANTKGVAFLLKKNKITAFRGTGRLVGSGNVSVTSDDGKTETLNAKSIIIATGSKVTTLPGIEIDEKRILSSTGALDLSSVPKHLVVVGAGVIGLELGSVWARLGAEVTVIEFLDRILPGMDSDFAKHMPRLLKKQGLNFKMSTKVTGVETQKSGVKLTVEPARGGDAETIKADKVLVAIGRSPQTEGLGVEEIGVKLTDRGQIEINDRFETSVPGIYAIGDCVRGAMLAHKAEEEGVALAEQLAGQAGHVNYGIIPGVVYTSPEIAAVGKTEDELKETGTDYNVGKFSFMANGRAKANQTPDGFVKVLADAKTDRVLGVHILGAGASEMIHEAAVLMEFSGSAEDLARTCHAHPTMSEAVKEAAMAVAKREIHA